MATVTVILQESIRGLGRKHEAVSVKAGYALNFLLPNGYAIPSTPARLAKSEELLEKELIRKERIAEQAKELQSKIQELKEITLFSKTSENQHLYGSITEKDIAEELEDLINVRLEKKHIRMNGHIKTTGEHSVTIRLTDGVDAELKVVVEAQK